MLRKQSPARYRQGGDFTQFTDFLPNTLVEIKTLEQARQTVLVAKTNHPELKFKIVKNLDKTYTIFST